MDVKSGFIAVVGKPNSGKSSLINTIIGEKLTLVSHKANATRKRSKHIFMYKNNQFIFVDTPGIHEVERLLNQFMLNEALKALGDCDVVLFLAPITDSLDEYEKFLTLQKKKIPHILLLTKIDLVSQEKILKKINEYQKYQDKFSALLPISIKKSHNFTSLYEEILKLLPICPYFYDPELLSVQSMREIYKEFIQESIFKNISDEIPYFSDVIIEKVEDNDEVVKINATIIVDSESQKAIVIGKSGFAIKRIGKDARILIKKLVQKKVFLKLFVKSMPNWSKNKKILQNLAYNFE